MARPGLYEVESGATLREVLDLAGGIQGTPKAILLGGAAGGFVTPDDLDIRLTFEDARAGGYTLGSGVVMAFNESVDLVDIVLRIARFFRDESCGQCVPCRVGTVRQEEALHRLVARSRARVARAGAGADRRDRAGHAGRVDLRPGSDGGFGRTVRGATTPSVRRRGGERMSQAVPLDPPRRLLDLEVDGQTVRVAEGATILDACRAQGVDTPTLCYADNLTPVNACRVCVVEVEGARTLVPACSRARPRTA